MPGARDVALGVLMRVEQGGAWAAPVLAAALKRFSDRRDAAFATELVLGVLRRRPFLDRLLESASEHGLGKIDLKTRQILRIGAYQLAFLERIPARAVVSEAVRQTRQSSGPGLTGLVNALLRALDRRGPATLRPDEGDRDGPIEEIAVHLGLPAWLWERLLGAWGRERAFAMARRFNRGSRRTLRVNAIGQEMSDLLERLGSACSPGSLTPWSIDVDDPALAADLAEEGIGAYQDEGAGLAALALAPAPGQRILDACAGRGGKTGTLAMMTGGRADLFALDRSGSKLERLAFELERQRFAATPIVRDLAGEQGLSDLGLFDRVLLDAPCSGTGTIGRRPELRWRLEPEAVARLAAVQARMLEAVSGQVAPGGRLVYAVCSLLPEEGLGHAERFFLRHPEFRPVEAPPERWPGQLPWDRGRILVDPAAHGTDGYQMLVMERKPAPTSGA